MNTKATFDDIDVKCKVIDSSTMNMNLYCFAIEMLNTSLNKKLLSRESKKLITAIMNHIINCLLIRENDCIAFIDALGSSINLVLPHKDTKKSVDYLLKCKAETTAIVNDDNEQEARKKVLTRRMYAVLASTCKKRNIKLKSITKWKSICDDPDEFLEVRRVHWD